MECFDDRLVAQLVDGALDAAARAAVNVFENKTARAAYQSARAELATALPTVGELDRIAR